MGEVYRADDLKLGQPVALKFLPPALAQDSVRRERFFAEVRITRQLSHPNICRVYDIGEVEGRHFLSMEYIDWEDLASLMKRIGHLSNEKALDIARQLVAGLTVAHERGIQRCMEKDSNARPASVAQLVQALPGGDPLAAAIAAGETPSPEMVAASGSKEGLRPAVAWGLLVAILLGWLAIIAMNDRFTLYRQSPQRLLIDQMGLTNSNPPLQFPGEALVVTHTEGRLVLFRCVPPPLPSASEAPQEPDWTAFIREAGIDQLKEVSPQRNPPFYADTRKAWQGLFPDKSNTSIQIEAAALQEKPVSFEIIGEWPWAETSEPSQTLNAFSGAFLLIVAMGSIFFARRNIRMGRGDRRSATRIALFTLALMILGWIPVLPLHNSNSILLQFLMYAGFIWVCYVAIEPFARRRGSRILVSWTRLLSGDWKDPLVAREALIGAAFGMLWMCFNISFTHLVPSWLGFPEPTRPLVIGHNSILGARFFLSELPSPVVFAVVVSFLQLCFLFIHRVLLRNQIAAVIVFTPILAFCIAAYQQGEVNFWSYAIYLVLPALWVFVMMRFGLVAAILFIFTDRIFSAFPITLDTSAWYSDYGYVALAILATIVLYAFYTSLGGRPLFGTPRLDD